MKKSILKILTFSTALAALCAPAAIAADTLRDVREAMGFGPRLARG